MQNPFTISKWKKNIFFGWFILNWPLCNSTLKARQSNKVLKHWTSPFFTPILTYTQTCSTMGPKYQLSYIWVLNWFLPVSLNFLWHVLALPIHQSVHFMVKLYGQWTCLETFILSFIEYHIDGEEKKSTLGQISKHT